MPVSETGTGYVVVFTSRDGRFLVNSPASSAATVYATRAGAQDAKSSFLPPSPGRLSVVKVRYFLDSEAK